MNAQQLKLNLEASIAAEKEKRAQIALLHEVIPTATTEEQRDQWQQELDQLTKTPDQIIKDGVRANLDKKSKSHRVIAHKTHKESAEMTNQTTNEKMCPMCKTNPSMEDCQFCVADRCTGTTLTGKNKNQRCKVSRNCTKHTQTKKESVMKLTSMSTEDLSTVNGLMNWELFQTYANDLYETAYHARWNYIQTEANGSIDDPSPGIGTIHVGSVFMGRVGRGTDGNIYIKFDRGDNGVVEEITQFLGVNTNNKESVNVNKQTCSWPPCHNAVPYTGKPTYCGPDQDNHVDPDNRISKSVSTKVTKAAKVFATTRVNTKSSEFLTAKADEMDAKGLHNVADKLRVQAAAVIEAQA